MQLARKPIGDSNRIIYWDYGKENGNYRNGLLVSRPKMGDSSLGGQRSLSGVLFCQVFLKVQAFIQAEGCVQPRALVAEGRLVVCHSRSKRSGTQPHRLQTRQILHSA